MPIQDGWLTSRGRVVKGEPTQSVAKIPTRRDYTTILKNGGGGNPYHGKGGKFTDKEHALDLHDQAAKAHEAAHAAQLEAEKANKPGNDQYEAKAETARQASKAAVMASEHAINHSDSPMSSLPKKEAEYVGILNDMGTDDDHEDYADIHKEMADLHKEVVSGSKTQEPNVNMYDSGKDTQPTSFAHNQQLVTQTKAQGMVESTMQKALGASAIGSYRYGSAVMTGLKNRDALGLTNELHQGLERRGFSIKKHGSPHRLPGGVYQQADEYSHPNGHKASIMTATGPDGITDVTVDTHLKKKYNAPTEADYASAKKETNSLTSRSNLK